MSVVRISAVAPDTYETRNGKRTVTPEMIEHWITSHAKLLKANVRIPIPWGHNSKARPFEQARPDSDEGTFQRSRYNAGYLKGLEKDANGEMVAIIDAPGLSMENGSVVSMATLPDGTPVKTAIKEVSLYADDWTDGKGGRHKNIIQHIALTPFPVFVGKEGFTEMSLGDGFSADALILAVPVKPDAKKDGSKPEPKKQGKDGGDSAGESDGSLSDLMDPQNPEDPEPQNEDDNKIQQIVAKMTEAGAPLPEGTDATNFLDRMLTAFTVLFARKQQRENEGGITEEDDPDPADPKNKKKKGPVTEDSNSGGGSMTMSTLQAIRANPLFQALADERVEQKNRDRKEWSEKVTSRVEAMRKRGIRPPIAERFLKAANAVSGTRIELATIVGSDGQFVGDPSEKDMRAIDQQLDDLDQTLPGEEWKDTYMSTIAGRDVRESGMQEDDNTEDIGGLRVTPAQKAAIEKRVKATSSR